ncbi:hypothetical protein Tco_0268899 [Tanacetum coccineum]
MPDALTEREWGFEHTKVVFLNEIIPFVKTLKDIFNVFDKDLLNEVTEVQTVFNQMEAVVQQYQMYKQLYDSIKPTRVHAKEQTESLVNQVNQKSIEIFDLNVQVQEKVFVITALKNNLRKLKGKDIVDNFAQMSKAATIALGMYKLDPVILALKVKNNREAHEYYLKHTIEQAAILREVVEQAKSRNPLDSASYSACMYVKLIQELLGNIPKVTNRPLLSSTGVDPSTSASGSKPSSNT